jgi:HEAT repeat protein
MEVAHRAHQCLTEIDGAPDTTVAVSAVRLLGRRAPADAGPVLLEFVPFAGDEFVEKEVHAALGAVAVVKGKPTPALEAALHDMLPARRAAAAVVLARWGNLEQRVAVRRLLADDSIKVRTAAARGLLGDRFTAFDAPINGEDRAIFLKAGGTADVSGLLAFFRGRILDTEKQRALRGSIEQLDSNSFTARRAAGDRIIATGPVALAFLRDALQRENNLEVTRRLNECIAEIEKRSPGPAVPIAAVRLLSRRRRPEAGSVLLEFLPFADDAAVQDEVTNALAQLAVQESRLPETLRAAVRDELPARRGLAALVLGMTGTAEDVQRIRPLVADADAHVRLRAANGLLAARDRSAVPILVALLDDAPLPVAAQAEELLRQLATDDAPPSSISDSGPDARQKTHQAWTAWWRQVGDQFEVSGPVRERPFLGLTLVAELSGGRRFGNHRVWEFGRDGLARWELTDSLNPIDAQILPNHRLLVAEYSGNRVTERDLHTRQIVWEKKTTAIVVSCQRLPNGNTFIATYNGGIMEVRPNGKDVYAFNPAANGIVNALKLRNGQVACLTAQGQLLELDTTGRVLRTTMLDPNGGWNGLEELPGGRLLVALQLQGKVVELDNQRKTVAECPAPGAVHAVRLPSGHLLVACGNLQKVIEVDRGGKVVWEKITVGRPFHVRRR